MARETASRRQFEDEMGKAEPLGLKISRKYKMWLRKYPKATHQEKIEKFDEICDELTGK